MSVRVTDNTATIILTTHRGSSLAVRYLLDEVHQIADPRTPKQRGSLRGNVLKTVIGLSGTIKWGQKYASIQEGKKFKNYTTSGTGPHYAEKSVESVIKSPQGAFRKARLI